MNEPIKISGLYKNYGEKNALNDISFNVEEGEIFGLIGPDGAGKTSIIRIIATLILFDKGNVEVFNLEAVKNYRAIRKRIGYMPGRFALYQDLTVEENINLFATIFGTTLKENYELVAPIYSQIEPFKKRRAGKLSGGMKQKLALSCALIHKPDLLLLDEPTTGVDPVSRKEFWDMLKSLKSMGITILVSTPYMDEARLCDRVALMQEGKLLSIDTPLSLIKNYERKLYSILTESKYHVLNILKSYEHTKSIFPFGEFLHYTDKRVSTDTMELKQFLKDNNLDVYIHEIEPTVEDCFMALMVKK